MQKEYIRALNQAEEKWIYTIVMAKMLAMAICSGSAFSSYCFWDFILFFLCVEWTTWVQTNELRMAVAWI